MSCLRNRKQLRPTEWSIIVFPQCLTMSETEKYSVGLEVSIWQRLNFRGTENILLNLNQNLRLLVYGGFFSRLTVLLDVCQSLHLQSR